MIRTRLMSNEYGLNSHYEYNECIHNVLCNALPKKSMLSDELCTLLRLFGNYTELPATRLALDRDQCRITSSACN